MTSPYDTQVGRIGRQPTTWSAQIAPFGPPGRSPVEGRLAAPNGGYGVSSQMRWLGGTGQTLRAAA